MEKFTTDTNKLINKVELADELNVSVSTVNNYMRRGMPYYRKGLRLVLFDLEECHKFIFKKEK